YKYLSDETNEFPLRVTNLCKCYNGKTVVDNVSFNIKAGECFGLLGSNGAGKTTTFGILSGEISLSRASLLRIGNLGLIGYCPQDNTFDELLTVGETFEINGMIQGYNGEKLTEMIKKHLHKYHLSDHENKLTKFLSGGYKRLVCLALSTFNDYKLILLDEPTAGIDQKLRQIIHILLKSEIEKGRALLLTTHCLEDCEYLCSRIAIMNEGSTFYEGTLEEFANL
uniref:ABC transporter domain-containing protein n=1 Tax=Romanomermis culicivorax TaxID=13658 RepID=A0A915JW56_ROMCU